VIEVVQHSTNEGAGNRAFFLSAQMMVFYLGALRAGRVGPGFKLARSLSFASLFQ
jgi:hypothetical protein